MSNSGTIQAANNASIKAVNLTNTSQIAADRLRIDTDTDRRNIGGQISANTALNIQAGGDIIGKSTTVTGTGTGSGEAGAGVYSATVLDRAASFNVILGCAGGAAGGAAPCAACCRPATKRPAPRKRRHSQVTCAAVSLGCAAWALRM